MTVERKMGAVFCLVGAFLVFMLSMPLLDTKLVTGLWVLGMIAGALVLVTGLWLVVTGKADPSET